MNVEQTRNVKSFVKKNWLGLMTAILTLGVLVGWLFLTDGVSRLTDVLYHVNKVWIALSLVSLFIYWFSDAMVLNMLTTTHYKNYSKLESFKTRMIGLLYDSLTPMSAGGEPMQVYEMTKTGIKAGDAVSIITVKSLIFQGTMIIYGVFSAFFTWRFFSNNINHYLLYIIFGLLTNLIFVGIILLICVNKRLTQKISVMLIQLLVKMKIMKKPEEVITKTNKHIELFHDSVMVLKDKKKELFYSILITIFQLTSFYAIPYCIYRGFHLNEASLFYMIAANALITMITSFIPLPGAAGAAEGSFYLFFAMFFVKDLLLPGLLLWRVITYYTCIIFAGGMSIFMITDEKRRNFRNKKRSFE